MNITIRTKKHTFTVDLVASVQPTHPTSFEVWLANVGERNIACIKEVRSLNNLGLIEAKNLVESVAAGFGSRLVLQTEDQHIAKKAVDVFKDAGSVAEIREVR